MKHTVLLVSFLFISLLSYGQKIKIKKGEVFIDKIKVAHIEKKNKDGIRYFQVSDMDKKPLFKAGGLKEYSLLFYTDKWYSYNAYYSDQLKDTIILNSKKIFYLSKKTTIENALKLGLFSPKGFEPSKVDEIIAQNSEKPAWLIENLDKERELLSGHGHTVDHSTVEGDIHLVASPVTKAYSKLTRSMVDQIKYKIYKGNPWIEDEEHILIGHAINEIGVTRGEYFFIYNTKKLPVASYHSMDFNVYNKSGIKEHELQLSVGSKKGEIIRKMIAKLIDMGKL